MSSIVDHRYRNATDATSGGWAFTDKLFGTLDKLGHVYNQIRYPQPGDPGYVAADAQLRLQNEGIFGLQKPWGAVLLLGGLGLLAWGLMSLAKK